MKKKRFWQIVKSVLLFVVPAILKNQKGIKNTRNEQKVDEVTDIIKGI